MTQDEIDRLLVVASLAVRVESRPERRDGSTPTSYESSGATLARRIRARPQDVVQESRDARPEADAPYGWNITMRAGAARRTLYTAWLKESPEEVERILQDRRQREQLRSSLSHDERKKAPWGRL